MNSDELKPIVDALIFASDTPLSMQKIKQILDEVAKEDVPSKSIREAIDALNRDNRDSQRGFFLQEVAGGYQLRTRPNYAAWVKKLLKTKPFRLTQSTLETLAIIVYKQPITRAEVDKLRGVDSGGVVKNLLERNILKIVGRKNIPGRPFLLGSTKRFLEMFGLEKLADLPSLKEFEDLDEAQLPTILRQRLPVETAEVVEEQPPAVEGDGSGAVTESDLAAHSDLIPEEVDGAQIDEGPEPVPPEIDTEQKVEEQTITNNQQDPVSEKT
ncbi:MAG: SMC-Scp complex subunit ScpB [Deltaproteobacteria bacterium]|nr:SMC-Scp complex subunit ScpB [Deltaproteobacteria bacterium]